MTTPLTAPDMHRLAEKIMDHAERWHKSAIEHKHDSPLEIARNTAKHVASNLLADMAYDLRSTFPLPSPPVLPSPADDWRERCKVTLKENGQWDVESPCGRYWLDISEGWMSYAKTATSDRWGVHHSEKVARSVLAKASPPPPLPAKVAGDGTVDAAFVAANAGEYQAVGDSRTARFVSDGDGDVRYVDPASATDMRWSGTREHISHGTLFRPLPLPPKDNKCETSSSPASSPSSSSASASPTSSPSAASPNPSEPASSGEPVMRYDAVGYPSSTGRYVLYADHKRHTARLQSELAGVRGEAEAMRPVVDAANKWQDHFAPVRVTVPASANLELEILRYRASRPLAPAEVSRG